MSRLVASPSGWRLAAAAGVFSGGVAAGFALQPSIPATLAAAAVIAVIALLLSTWLPARTGVVMALAAALAVLGLVRGSAAVEPAGPGRVDGHLGVRSLVITGVVRVGAATGGSAAVVDAARLEDADTDVVVSGAVLVTAARLPALAPGDRVEIDAAALRAPGRRPGPRSEAVLEREGVRAVVSSAQITVLQPAGLSPSSLIAWIQGRLVAAVNAVLPEPGAALLLGVAFGIRRPLSAATRAPLQDSGLIHIVVVSGLKVVLVLGMIAAVARALEWSRLRTLLVTAPVIAAYVLVSGAGPAAVRSAVMAGVALLARSAGRRVDPLPLLALVAAAMLGAAPSLTADPGFQLSFLGTAGILALAAPLAARLPGPRLLAEPFAVTVAAQLATVPVMAGTFGVVSLVGPLANALVLPLLPMLIVLGGLGAGLSAIQPALGWLPLQVAGAGIDLLRGIAAWLTAIPGAAIHIGSWPLSWSVAEAAGLGVALAIWFGLRHRARGPLRHGTIAMVAAGGLLTATATGVVAATPDRLLHMTLLDVGAAPAVLVQAGDGELALIDGGSSPSALLQAVGRALPPWTRHLDMVVITGGDQDAVAGLAALPGHYSVGAVIVPAALNPGAEAPVAALQAEGAVVVTAGGRGWRWGGALWRCLRFEAAKTGRPECVVTVADGSGRGLVLGMAGTADQEELAALYGRRLATDVLVTPPGGALSPVLLGAAGPAAVAVPAARGAAAAPAAPGCTTQRTAVDGDLGFTGGPSGLEPVT